MRHATSPRSRAFGGKILLLLALTNNDVEAGFTFGTRTRTESVPIFNHDPAVNSPASVASDQHHNSFKLPQLPSMQVALPALSYAGLATATAGTIRVLQPLFTVPWQPFALAGATIGLPVLMVGAQLLTVGGVGVARSLGGVPTTDPLLLGLASGAADAVGVPPPTHVFVIPRKEPNAFAASGVLRRQATTVGVTQGLLDILSNTELSAVLAHEMGHLRNRDVPRNMHVAVVSAGLGGVYEAGRILLRSSDTKKKSSSKKDEDDGSTAAVGLGLMAGGLAMQGVAHMLRLAASREAELRADHAAAEAFGANTLISALKKINNRAAECPADLRTSTTGRLMAHAMISDGPTTAPALTKTAKPSLLRRMSRAVRTHPPLDERVAALEQAVTSGSVPAADPHRSRWF